MTTLHYKDYQGAVTYEDGTLVIQILHIDDSISTTCESARDAQSAFQDLVDDYIETCEAVGKQPNKPFKGTLNIRVGSSLHKSAAMAAADAGDTLNAWISGAIKQRLSREQLLKVMKEYSLAETFTSGASKEVPHRYRFESQTTTVSRVSVEEAASDTALSTKFMRMLEQGPGATPWSSARHH